MINTILIVIAIFLGYFFCKYLFSKHCIEDRVVAAFLWVARILSRAKRKTRQVDNINWCYLEAGNPNKPTMLLIHGFGVDKYNWLSYLPELAEDFHLIVPDLPGFGDTHCHPSINSYALEEQVSRLDTFVKALQLAPCHLAGNSMGGLIAGIYTAAKPSNVKTLALLDAVGLSADKDTFLLSCYDQGEFKLLPRTVAESREVLTRAAVTPPNIPSFFLRHFLRKQEKKRASLETTYGLVVGYQRDAVLHKVLPQLTLPVLILWGKSDELLDVSGAYNAMPELSNGQLVILDDIGHAPMAECPVITGQHHKQFIALATPEKH